MVTPLAILIVLSTGAAPAAKPECVAETSNDAKSVAWLAGQYKVLKSRNDQLFLDKLTLSGGKDLDYLEVVDSRKSEPVIGTAKYILCGLDKVKQLEISLKSGKTLYCIPHYDYQVRNRLSCSFSLSDPAGDHELWIQQQFRN